MSCQIGSQHSDMGEGSNLASIVQVVSDVLEDWCASSYGQALQQEAPLACLTLKMKAVQSLEIYLLDDKMSYTRRLEYKIKFEVQLFSNFSLNSLL